MLELGCWLISHLCAHSIDRLPADCWAGWDSHWVSIPSLAVSLPLFLSLSFCFGISQQHQKCFNRALMVPAPNLTSSTHSRSLALKHSCTHTHAHTPWVGNSLLVEKSVEQKKERARCADGGWHALLFSPPALLASIFHISAHWLTWPDCLDLLFDLLFVSPAL